MGLFGLFNKKEVKSFGESGQYNPNAFQYGGQPGGADEAANRYRGLAEQAQGRLGEQVNYGQANDDRSLGLSARAGAAGMANSMAARANGLVPSITQQQADRQMQQAQAAQLSAAASARGAGGLALAQQNAAGNIASMQSAISGQAQINAAQEQQANAQAAYNAYAGLRGGDLASQQQSAQQGQYQAQINAAQRAQNDQYSMGLYGNEMGVRNSQLNAGMQQQAILAGSYNNAQNVNAGIAQNNANRSFDLAKMAVGAGTGLAGSMIPGKASGGPVSAGMPYLVGELGPELVVPQSDATVIPSGLTLGLLGQRGRAASSGPAEASAYKLGPGGGVNVLETMRDQSSAPLAAARNPSARGGY